MVPAMAQATELRRAQGREGQGFIAADVRGSSQASSRRQLREDRGTRPWWGACGVAGRRCGWGPDVSVRGDPTCGGRGLQGAWSACSIGSRSSRRGPASEDLDAEAAGTTRGGRSALGRGVAARHSVAHFYFIYTSLTEKISKNSNKTPHNFVYQSCRTSIGDHFL
jgi:hypothetical protein